ncbi:MAG: hypothetical protein ACRDD1_12305 [Planctomycetia bacterium]
MDVDLPKFGSVVVHRPHGAVRRRGPSFHRFVHGFHRRTLGFFIAPTPPFVFRASTRARLSGRFGVGVFGGCGFVRIW